MKLHYRKITIAILLVILVVITLYQKYDSVLGPSNISQEDSNSNNQQYKAKVTFTMVHLKEISDVKLMVVYPNERVEYLTPEEVENKRYKTDYEAKVEKSYLEIGGDADKEGRPEFYVTWNVDGRKRAQLLGVGY